MANLESRFKHGTIQGRFLFNPALSKSVSRTSILMHTLPILSLMHLASQTHLSAYKPVQLHSQQCVPKAISATSLGIVCCITHPIPER